MDEKRDLWRMLGRKAFVSLKYGKGIKIWEALDVYSTKLQYTHIP